MKILNAAQIRQADAYTIKNEPVKSIDLMERAAKKCVDWILVNIEKTKKIHVVCGLGNNGGDGLVIARHLHKTGFDVQTIIIKHSDKCSEDFKKNFDRLKRLKGNKIIECKTISQFPEISENDIIIDAVFGSGLSKSVEGFPAQVIQEINKTNAFIVAVDLPSGLLAEDNTGNNFRNIVKANVTLTFQVPKLSFLFPENYEYTGEWILLDIGLDPKFIEGQDSKYYFITADDIRPIIKPRTTFSHKGTFGHALLLAGSYGKMGAAVLGAKAALRCGAGLLTTHIPACGYHIMQTSLPEAMCTVDEERDFLSTLPDISKYNSMAIGPGIGQDERTAKMLKLLIQNSSVPLIFDADALNILAENKTWLSFLPKGSILTPHPGEFARLAGKPADSMQRLEMQREMSVKYGIYILYKGAFTTVSTPDGRFFFNSTGNPGMATGGSGDVLTGILLGLKSCGYTPFETCIIGAFLHGFAGDLAAKKLGETSLIAGDIVKFISKALQHI